MYILAKDKGIFAFNRMIQSGMERERHSHGEGSANDAGSEPWVYDMDALRAPL